MVLYKEIWRNLHGKQIKAVVSIANIWVDKHEESDEREQMLVRRKR